MYRVQRCWIVAATLACPIAGHAQLALHAQLVASEAPATNYSSSNAALPDDPGSVLAGDADDAAKPATRQQVRAERTASLHMKYIPPGWKVRELRPHDKVLLGFRDLYNPYTIGTIVVAASYSHLANGQPNYGTNSGAFGQRVGAAFLRDSTEGIFTDAVFAPLLHEDPRYYVEGSEYGVKHRAIYALTRPFLTRTDSGHSTINGSLLLGYAGASALSYTYYPQINRNFHDTAATFGGSLGGAALGFIITEFGSPLLEKLHLAPSR
jgi:hypothetical protein